MASSNPRYANWKERERIRRLCINRVENGEPCALCGRPIDLDLKTYVDPRDGKRKRHPWSMEVDEIVPLSCGGDPIDPRNVQPAHRICNQRKGNGRRTRRFARSIGGATSRVW